MVQMLVRNLEDDVKIKLRDRARSNGRSIEEEVREILRIAVREDLGSKALLGSRLAERFAGIGLDDDILELRGQPAKPAESVPASGKLSRKGGLR